MCELNAYILREGEEELVMESVGSLVPVDGKITLKSIFGETISINGALLEVDLIGQKIRLKPL
ncbi:MAG: CooT family nickel-binding protein [Desulfomonilaceae bacterium]|jgi:predicted RNA-binding protein|nr:CooT family nickel-binding protein [Syntrophaceae bacterium]